MDIQTARSATPFISITLLLVLICGVTACEQTHISEGEKESNAEKYVAGYKYLDEAQRRKVDEIFQRNPAYLDKKEESWIPYAWVLKMNKSKLERLKPVPMMHIDPKLPGSDQRYVAELNKLGITGRYLPKPSIVGLTKDGYKDNPRGNIFGSGFCVGKQLVVSAAHVLYGDNYKNSKELQMQYVALPRIPELEGLPKDAYGKFDIFEIDPSSIHVVPNHDLVVFGVFPTKTKDGSVLFLDEKRCPPMEYESNSNNVKFDDRLTLIGIPQRNWSHAFVVSNVLRLHGDHPAATRDGVNCAVKMLTHSFQGMSGGPILSERTKRVIGVFTWQRHREEEGEFPATDDNSACGETIFPLVGTINARLARSEVSHQ